MGENLDNEFFIIISVYLLNFIMLHNVLASALIIINNSCECNNNIMYTVPVLKPILG